MFEPFYGIPFVMFNFYLSLYMKELGVTELQLGYLISLGYISGTIFALISGAVTDRLGRKKTTIIFDFLAWPVAVLIYFFSNSFAMFALATLFNSFSRISAVSFHFMVIEDADNEQRIAALGLLNIINISTGIIIPVGGLLVNAFGLVTAERIFLAVAFFSIAIMMIIRHHLFRETIAGQRILDEMKKNPVKISVKDIIPIKAVRSFKKNPKTMVAAIVYVLFYIYIPIGTINSFYFARYVTGVLGIDESSISILGGIYSGMMLVVLVFITPIISRRNHTKNMQFGIGFQLVASLVLILIPKGSIVLAIMCIMLLAVGFGVFKPFVDSMLAEVSEGNDRAGIYSFINTVICISIALMGLVSGSIYQFNPRLIYVISIIILSVCMVLLGVYSRLKRKDAEYQDAGMVCEWE